MHSDLLRRTFGPSPAGVRAARAAVAALVAACLLGAVTIAESHAEARRSKEPIAQPRSGSALQLLHSGSSERSVRARPARFRRRPSVEPVRS